ncbi:MAG: hypothetical protein K0Q92_1765 [Steroidobacteraceae bacterium]|jgi:hypothetical protein|nr:hypothetical protein [Steroidobacteraceae bacterium]
MSWLGRLFGKQTPPPPIEAPLAQQLAADDFIGPRRASREVLGFVMSELKDQRGIHLETLFCALGALAGRACQESVRARALAEGKPADALFEIVTTSDGKTYYFGDALNQPLAEDRVSLWSLVAGAAAHDGARQLPDLNEIFAHNARVLGSGQFGVPRLPPEHPVRGRPIDYATKLWPSVKPEMAGLAGEPRMWPVSIGLAIQELMAQTHGSLAPEIVARIVMESAIPVSKIPAES